MLFSAVAASNSFPARIHLELSSRTTQSSLPLILEVCQSRCTAVKLCSRSYLIQAFRRFFDLLFLFAKTCSRRTLWILLWGIRIRSSRFFFQYIKTRFTVDSLAFISRAMRLVLILLVLVCIMYLIFLYSQLHNLISLSNAGLLSTKVKGFGTIQ